MQSIELERKKLDTKDDEGLGQIVREERAYIPPVYVKGGDHDFIVVFCDGAWVHFPIR